MEGSREAIRAADAAGREAFNEARRNLGIELGLQPFEADFLLACSPIGAVADLRRAYSSAFRLLAEVGIIPKTFAASFPDGGNKTMDVDRLFADDGLAAPSAVGSGLPKRSHSRKKSRIPRPHRGIYHHLPTQRGPFNLNLRRFRTPRFREPGKPPADTQKLSGSRRPSRRSALGLAISGAARTWVPVLPLRAAADGLTPVLVTQPDRTEGNIVIPRRRPRPADPEWIEEQWGEFCAEPERGWRLKPYDGDRNGVRVLMGPERHARHLALRAAADQGLEALLDALAKGRLTPLPQKRPDPCRGSFIPDLDTEPTFRQSASAPSTGEHRCTSPSFRLPLVADLNACESASFQWLATHVLEAPQPHPNPHPGRLRPGQAPIPPRQQRLGLASPLWNRSRFPTGTENRRDAPLHAPTVQPDERKARSLPRRR